MDAVPVTLGQEFGGYAAQITLGRDRASRRARRASRRSRSAAPPPAPGSTRTPSSPSACASCCGDTGLEIAAAIRFEAQANRDALVELSGALKVIAVSLTKIANDLVLMGSGPRTGLGELLLPELQKGSSIMPGKVNPVIPEVVLQVAAQVIGNDTAITVAGTQGNFELNVRVPLIARNLLESIRILTSATPRCSPRSASTASRPTRRCCAAHAESTPAIATALNPHIGYDHGDRDRQGGGRLAAHDPRGRAREGRRRGDARRGARPARDGARLEDLRSPYRQSSMRAVR